VITGAASGIGVETARALASVGAAVVLAVRRPEAAERVAAGTTESTGNYAVTVRQLDLADQTSVTGFADGWEGPLHILVNNGLAGVEPHSRVAWLNASVWRFGCLPASPNMIGESPESPRDDYLGCVNSITLPSKSSYRPLRPQGSVRGS
jgi:NAD(P)-dependent dehydrogenase (short-subunit alcohol dehydrogenase family)